jgi:hypothetical protein
MNPKWTIFILVLWFGCALLAGALEMSFFGGGTANDLAILNTLTHPSIQNVTIFVLIAPNQSWWNAWYQVLAFNFSFLTNGGSLGLIFLWLFRMIPIAWVLSIVITIFGRMPAPV